jgi:DNA-binding transcriptional ArsR family regulator
MGIRSNRDIEDSKKKKSNLNEDDIFKSLNHQVRRDIVKFLGEGPTSFTAIKNKINSIDSPSLSYHLKNLEPLLIQKGNKYELSDIGGAAFNLLSKLDETVRISRYKRRFLYAYIITVFCWICASTIIPFVITAELGFFTPLYCVIVITIISTINEIIIWNLRKKY